MTGKIVDLVSYVEEEGRTSFSSSSWSIQTLYSCCTLLITPFWVCEARFLRIGKAPCVKNCWDCKYVCVLVFDSFLRYFLQTHDHDCDSCSVWVFKLSDDLTTRERVNTPFIICMYHCILLFEMPTNDRGVHAIVAQWVSPDSGATFMASLHPQNGDLFVCCQCLLGARRLWCKVLN